jgi:hypothetical protein
VRLKDVFLYQFVGAFRLGNAKVVAVLPVVISPVPIIIVLRDVSFKTLISANQRKNNSLRSISDLHAHPLGQRIQTNGLIVIILPML